MAVSKVLAASLVIFLFALHMVEAEEMLNNSKATTKTIDCAAACTARCRLASRQKMCHRACGTCCARCNCVPPGTSGNQDVCPCYATMTTHGGRRKCP